MPLVRVLTSPAADNRRAGEVHYFTPDDWREFQAAGGAGVVLRSGAPEVPEHGGEPPERT